MEGDYPWYRLVTGEDKRAALAGLLDGDRSIPAGRVENDQMVVITDEAAAGLQAGASQ